MKQPTPRVTLTLRKMLDRTKRTWVLLEGLLADDDFRQRMSDLAEVEQWLKELEETYGTQVQEDAGTWATVE